MPAPIPSDFQVTPLDLQKLYWPDVRFSAEQKEGIMSVAENTETVVVAGNKLGKDFKAGFIAVTFFVWPHCYFKPEYVRYVESLKGKPDENNPGKVIADPHFRRVITTSVKDEHLDVLWAEIGNWVRTCNYPLLEHIVMNHHLIRLKNEGGVKDEKNLRSYLKGQVTSQEGECMSGHHGPYTLLIGDEASGLSDKVRKQAQGWAKRELYIGNPNPCSNFFKTDYQQGTDLPFRKCITIKAEDSPNVKYGLLQARKGIKPTDEMIVPGMLSYYEYLERRRTWNAQRQCEGLDAAWYVGADLRLVTKEWLDAAVRYAFSRPTNKGPYWMGIDPAEGGDDTSWVIIDRHGVIDIESLPTQDTNIIFGKTLDKMKRWNVAAENVVFDRACGKAHADRLRAMGPEYNVRTVDFGTIKVEPKRGIRVFPEKKELVETKGEFVSRRSEMYWNIRELLERPLEAAEGDEPIIKDAMNVYQAGKTKLPPKPLFALPMPMCAELIRELSPVPLKYDELGRFKLIPKQDPNDPENQDTFRYLIGRSPDQADAFALAVYGMLNKPVRQTAGAL